MRWRIGLYKGPRIGDKRIQRHFAFFPVKIGGFQLWFEPYYTVESCAHVYGGALGAKWLEEHKVFREQDCLVYLREHHAGLTFLPGLRLFRVPLGAEVESPWTLNSQG